MQQPPYEEWMTLSDASRATGLSIYMIKRLIAEGRVQDKENVLDRRERLVNVTQLVKIQEGRS